MRSGRRGSWRRGAPRARTAGPRRVDGDEPLRERALGLAEIAAGDAERLVVDPKLVLDSSAAFDSPPGSGCSPSARRHRVAAAAPARSVPARASCRSDRRAHEVRKPRTGPPRASRSEVPRAQLAAAARAMTSSRPSRAVEGNKPAGRSQRRTVAKVLQFAPTPPAARRQPPQRLAPSTTVRPHAPGEEIPRRAVRRPRRLARAHRRVRRARCSGHRDEQP